MCGVYDPAQARIEAESYDEEAMNALIEVLNRLNQVPRYPVDADEPVISVGGDDFSKVIAWWAITPQPGNTRPIESYQDFVEDTVITRLERVPGVSRVGSFGGREHEVRITFDPGQIGPPAGTVEMASRPLAYLVEGSFPSFFAGQPARGHGPPVPRKPVLQMTDRGGPMPEISDAPVSQTDQVLGHLAAAINIIVID